MVPSSQLTSAMPAMSGLFESSVSQGEMSKPILEATRNKTVWRVTSADVNTFQGTNMPPES